MRGLSDYVSECVWCVVCVCVCVCFCIVLTLYVRLSTPPPPPSGCLSASLPCYSSANVNQQRGSGVFDRSISALLALNEAGYGVEGSGLVLDLVYNPLGAFLPPPQEGERIEGEGEGENTKCCSGEF